MDSFMQMNIYIVLLKLCENERRHLFNLQIWKKKKIYFFRIGFPDGKQQTVPCAISMFVHSFQISGVQLNENIS